MKLLKYLAGPELIWILVCIPASMLQKINARRDGQLNQVIENWATWLPVLVLILCMTLYLHPVIPRQYLMLRIVLATLIGSHFFLEYVLNAHTGGGPGVGTIYIVAYILIIIALPVAAIIKGAFIR